MVDELNGFEQDDLNDDDVMLVDPGDEVYCWVRQRPAPSEKEKAFQLAKKVRADGPVAAPGRHRHPIKEGNEPASFKALFPSWDDSHSRCQLARVQVRRREVDVQLVHVNAPTIRSLTAPTAVPPDRLHVLRTIRMVPSSSVPLSACL